MSSSKGVLVIFSGPSGAGKDTVLDFLKEKGLAQAQKKHHTLGGINQALQLAAPILQMFPNSGDFIDGDELMKRALNGQGMPQKVIREDEDVQKLREARELARQQQEAQAQQMAMQQSLIENADKLGRRPEEGSALQELDQQLQGGLS